MRFGFTAGAVGLAIVSAFSVGFVRAAWASDWVELKGAASDALPKMQGLTWSSIEIDDGDPECPALVCALLKGTFKRRDFSLVYRKSMNRIQAGSEGDFSLVVALEGVKTPFTLTAVAPDGQTESVSYYVFFPDWASASAGRQRQEESRWIPSLGVAGVNYSETGVPNFSQTSVTAKIEYFAAIANHWIFDSDASTDLFTLGASLTNLTVRYFWANLRAGYQLSRPGSPWILRAMAGLYYSQMSVSNSSFGYNPLLLPELYPALTRLLPKNRSLTVYLKYVPVNGFFTDSEIGTGISFKMPRGPNHSLIGSFEYSSLGYQASPTSYISYQNWSFSVGLTL